MKILIIEDDAIINYLIKKKLNGSYDLIFAQTLGDAYILLEKHGVDHFDLFVIDGCVNSKNVDTIPIIKQIREMDCVVDIVANSSIDSINDELIDAGATLKNTNKSKTDSFIRKYFVKRGENG